MTNPLERLMKSNVLAVFRCVYKKRWREERYSHPVESKCVYNMVVIQSLSVSYLVVKYNLEGEASGTEDL
jgi:hypothetical protein